MRRAYVPALLLVLVTVLVLPAAGGEEGGHPRAGGPPRMPPAPVRTAKAVEREIKAGRTFVGTVEPARRSVVGSEFAGLVVAYLVRNGDHVKEGQELAHLRTKLLDLRIAAAEARLKLSRVKLSELENGSRTEDVRQARSKLEQLDAEVALRKWQMEANEGLYKDRAISEDELRAAKLAFEAAQLSRAAQKAACDLVEAGPREERIEQARVALTIEDAELARLAEERKRYVICAPFDGWVVREGTEVGQWLAGGGPVADIVYLKEIDVVVQVLGDFVGGLRPGQDARVAFDAFPDRVFTGTIHRIVPQADLRGRTFPVRIRLQNPMVDGDPQLKAGMFAVATLAVGSEAKGLFVPKDALVLGGPQPMVWAVDPQSKTASPIPVTLGVAVDELIQVVGPLAPGTLVVTRGNERLMMPGSPVILLDD